MGFFFFLLISYILFFISFFFLFFKVGVDGWKGLVFGLNFVEWCKFIGWKGMYVVWLLFFIVNIFIYVGMAIDMVCLFWYYGFLDSVLVVFFVFFYFFYLVFKLEE